MKPKQADILRHASTLFNREGYQSPSIERIAEHAGISKMTFYRYYADKEALILAILKQKESEFMQDLAQITADKASAREKLFAVFDYYHRWFTCETFHGCMFTARCLNMARHRRRSGSNAPDLSRSSGSSSAISSCRC